MYCSRECRIEYEKFIHHVECGKKPLPPVLVVCTKMLLAAVDIAGSFKALMELLKYFKHQTVFDFDLRKSADPLYNGVYKRNLLTIVNSMAMSEHSKIVISEKMKATFDFPPFDLLWKTGDEREMVIDFFHNQLRIHNTNQLEMGEHTLVTDFDQSYWFAKTIGTGLCPFASLFNHSCDANVKRTCVDNKIVFVVGKPISAGEQLFISYGYSSYRMPRDERQKSLQKFSFTCDCVACVNNYPELDQLPPFDEDFVEPSFEAFAVKQAVAEFKKNCEFIEKNIKYHPCYETTRILAHNDHLLYQISRTSIG